jgi:hypothetical protein
MDYARSYTTTMDLLIWKSHRPDDRIEQINKDMVWLKYIHQLIMSKNVSNVLTEVRNERNQTEYIDQ